MTLLLSSTTPGSLHWEYELYLMSAGRLMGYDSTSFISSLIETYRCLAEKELRDEDIQQMRTHPLQLLVVEGKI